MDEIFGFVDAEISANRPWRGEDRVRGADEVAHDADCVYSFPDAGDDRPARDIRFEFRIKRLGDKMRVMDRGELFRDALQFETDEFESFSFYKTMRTF